MSFAEIPIIKKLIEGGKFFNANIEIDRILKDSSNKNNGNLSETYPYLILQSKIYLKMENFEESIKIANKIIKIIEKNKEFNNIFELGLIYSESLIKSGNISKGIQVLDNLRDKLEKYRNKIKNDGRLVNDTILINSKIDIIFGIASWQNGDLENALKYFKNTLTIRRKHEDEKGLAEAIFRIGLIYCDMGELEVAMPYFEDCLEIFRKLGDDFSISKVLGSQGWIYILQGDTDSAQSVLNESVAIMNNIGSLKNIRYQYLYLGILYNQKGEFEKAQKYFELSISLAKEIGNNVEIAIKLFHQFYFTLERGLFVASLDYFEEIETIHKKELKNNLLDVIYWISKVKILRNKVRAKNIYKAQQILENIIEYPIVKHELKVIALISLCDLYLIELKIVNDNDIQKEINFILKKLLVIAEKQKSYKLWAEIFFIQARLASMNLNISKARNFYVNAQIVAEKQGLNQLAIKISNSHDALLERINVWQKINNEKEGVNLFKKVDLVQIETQIGKTLLDDSNQIGELEYENPVFLTILNESGPNILTHKFVEEWNYDSQIFSALVSAFRSFSGEFFSESFDRAKFGRYNVILTNIGQVIICYVFEGKSYLAKKKLTYFAKLIKMNKNIWNSLEFCVENNSILNKEMVPSLGIIINEIFMKKIITG